MNLKQLEYIIALDQHKHFRKASEHCRITQATLSAMIGKIEEEIGATLFDRSKHPIKTTDIGKKVIELAKKIIAYRYDILAIKSESSKVLEGTIKLAVIPTVASSLLPLIIPKITELNPVLKLEISEVSTDEMKRALMADKIDLGILASPLKDPHFKAHVLYYEAMMLYGVKDRDREYVTSIDTKNRKVWLLKDEHCFRKQALNICKLKEEQGKSNNLSFDGNSFDTLINLANKFNGLTLVPELYYNQMSPERKKLTKHFQKPFPAREISLISNRPKTKKRTLELLSNQIKALIKDHLSTSTLKPNELEVIDI